MFQFTSTTESFFKKGWQKRDMRQNQTRCDIIMFLTRIAAPYHYYWNNIDVINPEHESASASYVLIRSIVFFF